MAAASPAKSDGADPPTVTLLVGGAERAFHIKEAVLFETSSFFKAEFTSDSRESSERIKRLPEEDETIFELFVDWVNHRRCGTPTDTFMQLAQLFVLAEKYGVPSLKSLMLQRFFLRIKERTVPPPLETLAYAYERTAQNSGMRRMVVDYLACEKEPCWSRQADAQTWLRDHPDLFTDVDVTFIGHTVVIKEPSSGNGQAEYTVIISTPFDGNVQDAYLDNL